MFDDLQGPMPKTDFKEEGSALTAAGDSLEFTLPDSLPGKKATLGQAKPKATSGERPQLELELEDVAAPEAKPQTDSQEKSDAPKKNGPDMDSNKIYVTEDNADDFEPYDPTKELSRYKFPTIEYLEDYADAVMKTKAMVNYVTNLQDNFATKEYRDSINASSDLITREVRRLSPKLDSIFNSLLSIKEYYLSCTYDPCDTQSVWHSTGAYNSSNKTLTVTQPEGTSLKVAQAPVFDERSPEGSDKTHVHDLLVSGAFEFNNFRLELTDDTAEGSGAVKSSIRSHCSIR